MSGAWRRRQRIRALKAWRFVVRRSEAVWRLLRAQKGTPAQIARGAALGVVLAFVGPPGLQLIPALLLASLMGASRVAAALGVFVSNPLTMPFIYPSAYKLGGWVTGYFRPAQIPDDADEVWQVALSDTTPPYILVNTMVGLVLIGSTLALIVYHVTEWLIIRHRAKVLLKATSDER